MNNVKATGQRPVTTNGEYSPPTGWVCYYIWDHTGNGYYTPHYINYQIENLIDLELADLKDYIIYDLERWAAHSDRYGLDIFVNVMPPVSVLNSERINLRNTIERKQEALKEIERLLTNTQD